MSNNEQKRLVVLGAAESGVGAAVLGKKQGWKVFVSDYGTIREEYRQILENENISFEQGKHTWEQIAKADCVVKSPGISEQTSIMKKIREANLEVCSEIEFGFRYKGDSKIIAITGSNGKSTTTALTCHILREAGYDVAMVGNIGYSFARQIAVQPAKWYVMEISSFQLDDIHVFRPDVAVLLNISPDHLDRYNYQFENYIAAKFRIAAMQYQADCFVVNMDDPVIMQYLDEYKPKSKTIFFSTMNNKEPLEEGGFIENDEMHIRYGSDVLNMSIHELSIKGKHNQYNSMAAGISARVAGIRKEKIRESMSTFDGLEHRLEYVATIRGVDFINDSKATNINSVWFALECMTKPVILILGGVDKGNDYNEIMELVKEKVKGIVCLGVDNKPIHTAFQEVIPNMADTQSMKDAVYAAYAMAEKGDVVLLSPACASFDLFKNYEDRGQKFKEAVREL